MAQLSDAIVTGKLAVTGKIFEGGTALDSKFAAGIGRSGNTIQILNANGNAISSLNLPLGAIHVLNGSFTLDSVSESNNTYTWTGSKAIAWNNSTVEHTDGWISSTQFSGGTISASHQIAKSYVVYKTGNSNSTSTSYSATISDVDPGQTVTIKSGYYPTDRSLVISKADVSTEVSGGAATITSSLSVNSGGTLPSFSDTAISGGYTVSIQPSYSVTAAGYAGTGTVSGTATTFYVKKGSVTSSVSGTNPTFTISKTGTFVDNASTYGITTSAPSSGTNGTNYLTLAIDGSSNSQTFTASMSFSDGYIAAKGTQGTASVSASKAGNGSFYVPIVTPAFDGGGVSSNIKTLDGNNITLGTTNNGIAITATPQASRTAVLYNGAKKGLINIADDTQASAAVGNTAGTATTKYVSAITVPSGKTLGTVTNSGGTITTLANNGTISTLSVPSGGSSTISTISGSHAITSNTGTLTISHGSSGAGNVTVKPYNSTTGYPIIVSGAVQKASIPNLVISGSGSASVSASSTSVSYSSVTTQPSSGYYITIGASGSVSGLAAKNSSEISAGWLDKVTANTTLGNSGSISVTGDTKYLTLNGLTGTNAVSYGNPAIGNLESGTLSKIGNSETTGYYFNIPTSATFTTSNNGYAPTGSTYGSGDKTQRYSLSAGSVTTGVSGTTSLSVTLSKTGTFINNASTYGIGTSAPASGTDGTNFLTLSLSGNTPSSTLSGTKTVTAGYIKTGNVTANGTSISASLSGGTSYYIPITSVSRSGNTVSWGTGLVTSGSSTGSTTSRSASTGHIAAASGVTLGDFLTTTSTNNYGGFVGYGKVSTGTGWISEGTTQSSNSSTYYIKAGALSDISGGGLTHGNTTFTAGTGYLTDTNTGYALTASNTASRAAISAGVSTAGWVPTTASKSVSATGNDTKSVTKYIIAGASTTQSVNGTATPDSVSNMTLSTSDSSSGISFVPKATGVSRRGKITTAGWMPLDTICGDTSGTITGSAQYLKSITLTSGKTLHDVTFTGGTIDWMFPDTDFVLNSSSNPLMVGSINVLTSNLKTAYFTNYHPTLFIQNLGLGPEIDKRDNSVMVNEMPMDLQINWFSPYSTFTALLRNNSDKYDPTDPNTIPHYYYVDLLNNKKTPYITIKDGGKVSYAVGALTNLNGFPTAPLYMGPIDLTTTDGMLITTAPGNISGGGLTVSTSNVTTTNTDTGISFTSNVGAISCAIPSDGWATATTKTKSASSTTTYLSGISVPSGKTFSVNNSGGLSISTAYTSNISVTNQGYMNIQNIVYGSNRGGVSITSEEGTTTRFYRGSNTTSFEVDDQWEITCSYGNVYFDYIGY